MKLDRWDWLFIIGLVLLIVFYVIGFFDYSAHPFEDAAILMRYSKHLAQGHGIVWNIGDKPVEGATDFLFMIILAGLAKAGISLEISVRLIDFVSHILTVTIIYIALRKLHVSGRFAALLSGAYLAIGPGLKYTAAFLGTPFFALFACITWYLAIKLAKDDSTHTTSVMFALSSLTMGLIRPEGVFLAIFMLLSVLYMRGLAESQRIILYFLLTFALIGGSYFLWRWHYFGYLLPNTFYKKSGGHLYPGSLMMAIRNAIILSFPFTPAFILGFRSSKTAKQTIFSLIPIAGFTALWVLIFNEMNYWMRFQYPILPIVLMSWPPLLKGIHKDWRLPKLSDLDRRSRLASIAVIVFVFLGILTYEHVLYSQKRYYRDGRYDVAVMLHNYRHKNYIMATTEAGLLPLYSDWSAIDTWGLNDPWIAHHGKITEGYLERYKPQIIVFHAYFSPIVPPTAPPTNTEEDRWLYQWFKMIMTLKNYAEKNKYHLAAAFGENPYNTHYYYVRSDFPESAGIIRNIQNMDYYWIETGKKSINYAMIKPSDER